MSPNGRCSRGGHLVVILRNGVDWKAFVAAFQTVQVDKDGTELMIQSIENKGDGVVVVRVSVPEEADKAKIHGEFNQNYDLALKALEAQHHAELQAKESEISIYCEQSVNTAGVRSQELGVKMATARVFRLKYVPHLAANHCNQMQVTRGKLVGAFCSAP